MVDRSNFVDWLYIWVKGGWGLYGWVRTVRFGSVLLMFDVIDVRYNRCST